jgi:hypothetical protein
VHFKRAAFYHVASQRYALSLPMRAGASEASTAHICTMGRVPSDAAHADQSSSLGSTLSSNFPAATRRRQRSAPCHAGEGGEERERRGNIQRKEGPTWKDQQQHVGVQPGRFGGPVLALCAIPVTGPPTKNMACFPAKSACARSSTGHPYLR